jgi:DNA-binding winged helix-turn-helix (wHTH) protein/tetratricopeptide (TPR) repeat protein
MAVLVRLAAAKGAVVSRNELLDAVWPRMAVTQDALSQCIVELRRAFGDDAKRPSVIETIPKIGIRLLPPVSPCAPDPMATTATSIPIDAVATPIPADAAAAPRRAPRLGPRPVVATLALIAVGAAAAWLIADRSATHPGAGVQTAAALPVGRARDFYLNGDDYLRRTNRLQVLKFEEEQYRRAVKEDPSSALAWAKLSRTHASFYWYGLDRTPGRCALAEQAARRALELQPDLPEGHLYLANYYHRCLGDRQRALAEFAIAERSIPDSAELHFLRASVYRRVGDWQLAVADGGRAIELDGRNAQYQRQQHVSYLFQRDYASAERVLENLLTLYPDDGTVYLDKVVLALVSRADTGLARRYDVTPPTADYTAAMAYTYTRWLGAIFDRDYDKALSVLAAAPEDLIFDGGLAPGRAPKALLHARTLVLAGRAEEAWRAFETVSRDVKERLGRQLEEDPSVTYTLTLALAEARVGLGQPELAREAGHAAREMWSKASDSLVLSDMRLAYVVRVLVPLGDTEEAANEIDTYLREPGVWSIEGLLGDPRLDPLRGTARFDALVAKYRR